MWRDGEVMGNHVAAPSQGFSTFLKGTSKATGPYYTWTSHQFPSQVPTDQLISPVGLNLVSLCCLGWKHKPEKNGSVFVCIC